MDVIIYHNPRCSKSRQTLALLRERGIEPTIVEYLRTPPDHQTLDGLLDLLGLQPRELMRTAEAAYREKQLGDPSLSREKLIRAMLADPILIQRPIVIAAGQGRIGRPPEAVLEILGE